jgi:transposase
MEHLAIDLGGRESQVCVRTETGEIVVEKRVLTRALPKLFSERPKSRVIVETCAEGFAVAEAAQQSGHEVRVVPATLVKALGVGARGRKTDVHDARALSEASCRLDLPSVHIPSAEARERKGLCSMREALVGARTQLINTVRGWLRQKVRQPRRGGAESFAQRVREMADLVLPGYVERQLLSIEQLSQQVREADRELERVAKQDPLCRRLMSVPGVGPVTAVRFSAQLDQVERFSGAAQVASYLGLVPKEHSSSERKRLGGITKAGARQVRWALVQAAWSFRRWASPDDPVLQWALEVEKRRGAKVAIVALAHKLSGILYALWRDGTTYQRRKAD